MNKKRIFLSHSYEDRLVANRIIDILLVPYFDLDKSKDIFFTSKRITGIKASKNWKEQIKANLKDCDVFISLISEDYKSSEMCLAEVGAAWVLDKEIFPIILPPITFNNFSTVINHLQAEDLSKTDNIESFLISLEDSLSIKSERKNLNELIQKFNKSYRSYKRKSENTPSKETKKNEAKVTQPFENEHRIIKEDSVKEWPNDFSMQVHYIKEQKAALEEREELINSSEYSEYIDGIYGKAANDWPRDYTMQVHQIKEQIEALKKLT